MLIINIINNCESGQTMLILMHFANDKANTNAGNNINIHMLLITNTNTNADTLYY